MMTMTTIQPDQMRRAEYLSPKEVADRIPGMTVSNLGQLRFRAEGPRYMKPSPKVVVYEWGDVVEWLDSKKLDGTSEVSSD